MACRRSGQALGQTTCQLRDRHYKAVGPVLQTTTPAIYSGLMLGSEPGSAGMPPAE